MNTQGDALGVLVAFSALASLQVGVGQPHTLSSLRAWVSVE